MGERLSGSNRWLSQAAGGSLQRATERGSDGGTKPVTSHKWFRVAGTGWSNRVPTVSERWYGSGTGRPGDPGRRRLGPKRGT